MVFLGTTWKIHLEYQGTIENYDIKEGGANTLKACWETMEHMGNMKIQNISNCLPSSPSQ